MRAFYKIYDDYLQSFSKLSRWSEIREVRETHSQDDSMKTWLLDLMCPEKDPEIEKEH